MITDTQTTNLGASRSNRNSSN